MSTIDTYELVAFCANRTDGTDSSKMCAVYSVIDTDLISHDAVRIPKTTHDAGVTADIETALNNAIN